MTAMVNVVHRKKEDLVVSFAAMGILLIVTSSMMYFVEHSAQPEVFPSIPETLYWEIITLTTVGYGDVVPITTAVRILAGVVAGIGIGMFGLPASILASGFIEEASSKEKKCLHCGEGIEEDAF